MIDYEKYWNSEFMLVQPNTNNSIRSQHNILEVSGDILIHESYVPGSISYKNKIIERYADFWSEINFLPRTISLAWYPDMDQEAKGDVWKTVEGYHFNSATSTTQKMYILFGIWISDRRDLVRVIMNRDISNGWAIRWDKETVVNGKFWPFGIMALQRCVMGMVTERWPGLLSKIFLWTTNWWSKLPKNYGFWGKDLNEGEWFGICIWLYWIALMGKPKYLRKFLPIYKDRLQKWIDDELAKTDEAHIVSDTIKLEMFNKMKGI